MNVTDFRSQNFRIERHHQSPFSILLLGGGMTARKIIQKGTIAAS